MKFHIGFLVLLLTNCGIMNDSVSLDIPFDTTLYNPTTQGVDRTTLNFVIPKSYFQGSNATIFEGLEFYYRIVAFNYTQDVNPAQNDWLAIQSRPSLDNLKAEHYYRFNTILTPSTQVPMIHKSSQLGSQDTFAEISFKKLIQDPDPVNDTSLTAPTFRFYYIDPNTLNQINLNNYPTSLYRNYNTTIGRSKIFNELYGNDPTWNKKSDPDLADCQQGVALNISSNPSQNLIEISIFVVAYGFDPVSSQEVWSNVAPLGVIKGITYMVAQ